MKKTFILLSLLLMLLTGRSVAQPSNAMHLYIGMDNSYLKDLNYSPLNYRGVGLAFGADYQRHTKNGNIVLAEFGFSSTPLEPKSAPSPSNNFATNIKIGFLKKLSVNNPRFTLHAGVQCHTYLDVVFYNLDTDAITFFGLHGFDVRAQGSFKIADKQSLNSYFSLPVIGQLVRPPYTGWDKYIVESQDNVLPVFFRGDWTSLNNFLAFTWRLSYQYQLRDDIALGLNYQLQYHHTDYRKEATIASNQLSLGFHIQF